ncbi:MAG: FAD-binding protein, partial [Alphaproteobacteria bacterium]
HLELVEKMHAHFGDELMGHLEFVRFDGRITCFGLPLLRYTTEERLDEIIAFHEDNGCPVFNPHRYTLEEGGMKMTDEAQLAFKRQVDPRGLLNPGKMIAWDNPDFDFTRSRTYLFPGIAAAE